MSYTIRSAVTVLAALIASSVAPAQVSKDAEPLTVTDSAVLPVQAIVQTLDDEIVLSTGETADPLAPSDEVATTEDDSAPPARPTGDLTSLVSQLRGSDAGSRELECLAVGVYFEAKSEPLAGQLAVGQVIANRASSGRFPSSYCGVLFQRSQFSFVRGHSYPAISRGSRQWQNAVAIARIVDQQLHDSVVPNALFFHAKRVQPRWRLTRVGSVGNHVFYR
jgi:spore germination cell wall hydrolase CwlJ-like protein